MNANKKDKDNVILAEQKLQDLGFVDYLENLDQIQKKGIIENSLNYFIPWRPVWNENSISTPCRAVFDASNPTSIGVSLNDTLANTY